MLLHHRRRNRGSLERSACSVNQVRRGFLGRLWLAAGDHRREIDLLGRVLAAQMRAEPAALGVDYDRFGVGFNAAAKPVRLRFSKSAIAAALEKVTYDGGTQLGAVGPLPNAKTPDLYLLFTDERSNFGRTEPARMDAPLDVFSTSTTDGHEPLRLLAEGNGGHYFALSRHTDSEILARLAHPRAGSSSRRPSRAAKPKTSIRDCLCLRRGDSSSRASWRPTRPRSPCATVCPTAKRWRNRSRFPQPTPSKAPCFAAFGHRSNWPS